MAHQGFDLQLTRYDERGWRATFYTTGMEHSPTGRALHPLCQGDERRLTFATFRYHVASLGRHLLGWRVSTSGPAMEQAMRRSGSVYLALVTTLLGMPCPAHALSFNVTFDPSTAGAPAGFATAFNSVISFYTTTYADPMTINLHVGWGDINGGPLAPGLIGQSLTNQPAVPHATPQLGAGPTTASSNAAADDQT